MTHLRVHSNHSLLEGVGGLRQLVGRAVEYGMKSLALTDRGGLYGAIPFYRAAREAGVKPILGVCLDGTVVLARDREGYSDLCHLVTAYHLDGDFELAAALRGDRVFVLSDDVRLLRGLKARGLNPLVAVTVYGDGESRYRAQQRVDFAEAEGLRAVAVSPVYFIEAAHFRIHQALTAIRLNTTLDNLKPHELASPRAFFRTEQEMEALYADWPETLAAADWVAEECNVDLELGKPIFPEVSIPKEETPFSHLWKLTFEGVKERYRPLAPNVIERLTYELKVINELGFASYFLIVHDLVNFARGRSIPIMGRGSAANSLVAYALGITRVDPFQYDLYFERFLNVYRTDCPDIDLDICWRRRDEVIDYVYERYGAHRVAMICTFNTFRARGAVREIAKIFGLTPREIDEITRQLPQYMARDIRAVVRFLPECRSLAIDEEPLKSIVEISEFIDGFPRHLSIHSGGVVIAPERLTHFTPLERAAKGIVITQYPMGPIEDLGLIKMDLLGHRSLTVIDDTLKKIHDNRGVEVDIESIPDPDPLTGSFIRRGRTVGCFQIESPAMRALLQHTLADNTDMLIKTLSLVRPGPSGSGMKKRFIARHLGKEETVYLHPSLREVLGDTYGIMLYQEDILKVANAIAGMDLAEGDALRRAMGKKRSPEQMAQSMKLFLDRASERGVDPDVGEEIWGLIANFARYSYCKAHASTYGEVAYQCTYLKAHFPAEFLSSVLSNRGGFYHPAVYLEEAKRLGISILPPDVNRSKYEYTVEGEAIRIGFVEIRDLRMNTVEAIDLGREEEPFKSLPELYCRTSIPVSDLEILVNAGACDGFGATRPALQWQLQLLRRRPRKVDDAGLLSLVPSVGHLPAIPLPDYSAKKISDLFWTALGLMPRAHPLDYYLASFAEGRLILSTAMGEGAGQVVTIAGWVIAERRVGLKDRGAMKFLTLEDGEGIFEAVLFPEVYQRYGHLLNSHGPYLITGEVQEEDHYCSLIVEHVEYIARGKGNTAAGKIPAAVREL